MRLRVFHHSITAFSSAVAALLLLVISVSVPSPGNHLQAQETDPSAAPVVTPPPTLLPVCYCLDVKCKNKNYYETFRGCDPGGNPDVARQIALNKAMNACANHGGFETTDIKEGPDVQSVCFEEAELLLDSDPLERMAAAPTDMYTVQALLEYRDGSPGHVVKRSRATYKEAHDACQKFLCLKKDPCKAACFRYCLVARPDCW